MPYPTTPTRTYPRAYGPSQVIFFPPKPPVATPSFTATLSFVDTSYFDPPPIGSILAINGTGGSSEGGGQSFVAGRSDTITQISLKLYQTGSAADNIILELLSGSITGTVLGTSAAVAISSLSTDSTNGAWATFTFSSVSLVQGTKYYIRLTRTGARSTSNRASWINNNDSFNPNYLPGGDYILSSGVWGAERTTTDALFRIEGVNWALVTLIKKITDAGFTATLSFVGAITKSSTRKLTAALSFIGNIATSLIHGGTVFTQSFTATLFSGWNFATGLVSYWKLDEASGTRFDSFGTNNLSENFNSSFTPQVGSVAGIVSNAASFFAPWSTYLSCASNSSLQMSGNTDFTIACWVQLTTLTADCSLVTKDSNVANSRDYTLDFSTIGNVFRFYIKGGATYIVSTGFSPTVGVWYFLVAWYNSANGQCLLTVNNGALYGSTTGATGTDVSAAQFRIGAREYAGFEDFAYAYIDEVAIWKRLLTPAEITALYNSGAGTTYGSRLATLVRLPRKSLTATLSSAAAIIRKITDAGFTASLSFVGAVFKNIRMGTLTRSLASINLSFVGTFSKTRLILKSLTATLSFVGNIATNLIHGGTLFTQSFTATLFGGAGAGIGTQTVTDDFNRANQNPITGNWTSGGGGSPWQIISNQGSTGSSGGSDADAIWNSWASGNDQYSQAGITAVGGGAGSGPGISVRHSSTASTQTEYRLVLDGAGNIELAKFVTGGYTFLASRSVTYVAGTKLGLAILGNTMTIWYGGVQQGVSVTDNTSPITTGVPGIAYSSILPTAIVDNWDAGTTGGAGPSATLSRKPLKSLTATLSFVAALSRKLGKALSATLSFVGALTRKTLDAGFTATLSFVGAITKRSTRALTATLSFVGTFAKNFISGGILYTKSFTATLFSSALRYTDDFNRANGGLGANWTKDTSVAGAFSDLTIVSNAVQGSTASVHSVDVYTASGSLPADQYAQCKVTATGGFIGLVLRSDGNGTFYVCYYPPSGGNATLYRWIAGSAGGFATGSSITPAVNDVIYFEVVGNVQTMKVNGVTVVSGTDSTITGAGYAGIDIYDNVGAACDDFEAGTIGGGGPAATLKARANKGLSATLSFIGTFAKTFIAGSHLFTQSLTATLSSTGALTKRIVDSGFTATLSFVGALGRRLPKTLAATLSFIGVQTASKSFLKALTATVSFVGAMSAKIIATRAFTATLSFVGASSRRANKAFAATLSFVSAMVKRITDAGFTGTLSFAASTTKRIVDAGFSATLSFIGNLAQTFIHGGTAFTQSLAASLSFVGNLSAKGIITRAFTATLNATATISRSTLKVFNAIFTPLASLVRRITRTFSAAFASAGSLVKAIRDAGFSATLSFVGNLVGVAAHFFTRAFTATLAFSATFTRSRLVQRVLTATLAFSGAISRRIGKALSATLAFSTAARKAIRKVFAPVLSFVGFIFRGGVTVFYAGQKAGAALIGMFAGSTARIGKAGSKLDIVERGSTTRIPVTGSNLRVERTK